MIKRFFQAERVQNMLAQAAGFYMDAASRTTRWEVRGGQALAEWANGGPVIVAFWHECLPAIIPVMLREGRRAGWRKQGVVLASRHRDGRLMGNAAGYFGLGLVLGSSSRGGAAGLRGLAAALRAGADVALTPDGPRGPKRVAAAGLVQLAALTGAPILPAAAWTSWAVPVNSWDRMRLPLPFGRGRLVCGEMITVARQDLATALPRVQAALTAAIRQAQALQP